MPDGTFVAAVYDVPWLPNALDIHGLPNVNIHSTALTSATSWLDANIPLDTIDLSQCKLMIFDACTTYLPGADNDICDTVVSQGVGAVIAWGHEVDTANTEWMQMFFDRTMRGDTVQQAVDYINTIHHDTNNNGVCICGTGCAYYNAVVVGDGNFQLYATQ